MIPRRCFAIALLCGLSACRQENDVPPTDAHDHAPEETPASVRIDADMAQRFGIETAVAGAGVITHTITLFGRVQPNAERIRTVSARYPGVILAVNVRVGDRVRAGQTLATVEANDSLQVYAIKAPIDGNLIHRRGNPGESALSAPLFEIADYASVWVDLSVFPADRARLAPGQALRIDAADGGASQVGSIDYLSAHGLDASSPRTLARAVLDNADGRWTPGQFVSAQVTVNAWPAAQVVPLSAVQRLRGADVVFAAQGENYEALPVTIGRRDAHAAEVLDGLPPETRIVTAHAYLLKAELEKSAAAHSH